MKKDLNALLLQLKANVKLLFEGDAPPAEAPAATKNEVKGKDGKSYSYDKLEAGGVLSVKDEAGTEAPAPAGEVEFEDGTKVTVGEAGVISDVKKAEEKKPDEKPADAPAFTEAEVKAAINEALAPVNESLKAANEANAKLQTQLSAYGDTIKTMFAAIELLADVPEADATDKSKHSAFKDQKTKKDEAKNAVKAAFS